MGFARLHRRSTHPTVCHATEGWALWTRTGCDSQTHAAQRSFPMTIIDSQVHVYETNTPKRPWHSVPNWPDQVTGDEMVAAMDKVGVDDAIFISAFSMYQY